MPAAKTVPLLFVFPILLTAGSVSVPAGHTGASGEQTCSACHTGSAPVPVRIAFSDGPRYRPGVKQRIAVLIEDWTSARYGFQLSARTMAATPQQAGALAPLNGSTTVLASNGTQYIQHANATASNLFEFEWTPPETPVGRVQFSVAAIAANGDGTPSSDRVGISSAVISAGMGFISETVRHPSGVETSITGINNSGTATGWYKAADESIRGFVRAADGTFTNITIQGATAVMPVDINNRGQVAGTFTSGGVTRTFVRQADGIVSTVDWPTGDPIRIFAISDSGELLGDMYTLKDGVVTWIPVPESWGISYIPKITSARGINSAGDVVGVYSWTNAGITTIGGFRRGRSGLFEQLAGRPVDINNAGAMTYQVGAGAPSYFSAGPLSPVTDLKIADASIASLNDLGVAAGSTGAMGVIATPCAVDADLSRRQHGAGVESGTIPVSADPGCSWAASVSSSDPQWITITQASGSVAYTLAANDSVSPRSGVIYVAGAPVTITQGGAACSYGLPNDILTVPGSGQHDAIGVNTFAGCPWTATSISDWLIVRSPGAQSGPGGVQYTALPNNGSIARLGHILIAGQFVGIYQPASTVNCIASVSPSTVAFGRNGGSANLTVTVPLGCAWIATSGANWLTTQSQSVGVGVVTLVAQPLSSGDRHAEVRILNAAVTVRQFAGIATDRLAVVRKDQIFKDNGDFNWTGADSAGSYGLETDVRLSGNWDGTGPKRLAAFRNGTWWFDMDGDLNWSPAEIGYHFGQQGDVPFAGDWAGDGSTTIGVFRNGEVFIDADRSRTWTAGDKAGVFGQAGDIPFLIRLAPGAPATFGVYRNGRVLIDRNRNLRWDEGDDIAGSFGMAGDKLLIGDWEGNGTERIAVYRQGQAFVDWNGNFLWDGSSIDKAAAPGLPAEAVIVGDWDGSGKSKIAVFRAGRIDVDWDGDFSVNVGTSDVFGFFGQAGDLPIVLSAK